MYSGDEVRDKINMYIYMLNKYNVYGIFAVFWLSWYMSLISLPSNAGLKTFFQTLILLVTVSFAVKYMLLITCGFRDVCECNLDEKDYVHPKRETCPVEENILGVYSDVRYLVEETVINVGFRYNFAALLAFFVSAISMRLFQLNPGFVGLFNITALMAAAVICKLAMNYFFAIQDYCPCACKYKPVKITDAPTCNVPAQKEIISEVDLDVDEMRKGLISKSDILSITNQEIDRIVENKDNAPLPNADELEQAIENEIKNMVPHKPFDDRLKDMCKIASDKLKRYDTIDNCLAEVNSNEHAKKTVYSMLMDDPTYGCLQGAINGSQFDICFKDYFSRNPHFLLRLVDAFPKQS